MKTSHRLFGDIPYWVVVACCAAAFVLPVWMLAMPGNNVLDPFMVFSKIFNGAAPDEIWAGSAAGRFPGAHFYTDHFGKADSLAMLFVNIGCGYGLFGLAPAAIYQLAKEKDWFCAVLGAILSVLILLSALGALTTVY